MLRQSPSASATSLLSRPGYGSSTRHPGRSVADVAADVRIVARDARSRDACTWWATPAGARTLSPALRCCPTSSRRARSSQASRPWGAEGLDWLDGMAPENVAGVRRRAGGEDGARPLARAVGRGARARDPEEVAAELRGLVSPVDRASLEDDYAEIVATRFRRAVEHGPHGWVDDDLAFTRDWGFRLADSPARSPSGRAARTGWCRSPTAPGSRPTSPGPWPRLEADAGHLSLAVARFDEIVADVVARGSGALA